MTKKYSDNIKITNNNEQEQNESLIDLSKIKNLEAIEKTDKEFAKKIYEKTIISGKNEIIPYEIETIPLPSRGLTYKTITDDEDVLNGFIKIREMRGHDEKILTTQRYLKDGTVLKRLLNNCIVSNIDAEDLTTFDFNYILFVLRSISYGDDYKFKQKCENYMCEREMPLECKISELKFGELPESFEEPILVKLPKSKFIIECVLTRQYHTDEIRKLDKQEEKKSEHDYDKTLIRKMVLTTIRIFDKNGKELDKKMWEEFYNQLTTIDIVEIREKTDFKTEIEGKEVVCPYCGTTQKIPVPIGADFFRIR